MGQYYTPIIVTEDHSVATVFSHDFDSGLKLMEHSWVGNSFVNAVYSLIHEKKRRVAWIGDYSKDDYEECDEAYSKAVPFERFKRYYEVAWNDVSKRISRHCFSKADLEVFTDDTKGMCLVNHDKGVYINLDTYIRESTAKIGNFKGWCIDPLPLLTACGNDRGGGDFHDGHIGYENVGIWAFDYLEYRRGIPYGCTEVRFMFIENSSENILAGKKVVVTGKLNNYSRDSIHTTLLSIGAKPMQSVSKNTNYLIVGENAGSKLDKAKEFSIKLLSESEFEAMLV